MFEISIFFMGKHRIHSIEKWAGIELSLHERKYEVSVNN